MVGKGELGTSRLAYTEDWMRSHRMAKEMLEAAGVEVTIDPIENLVGTRKKAEMRGSHQRLLARTLTPVPQGENFDGVLGAIAAKVIRALDEDRVETKRSIQINSFACEEDSRFGIGCIGSTFLVGEIDCNSWLNELVSGPTVS